ncbi:MAG: hypothetical protein IPG07_19970 [Crocinitomicaceae bacterium]|nr:hypothetical protein [Crocinitomicaceae bacterium]
MSNLRYENGNFLFDIQSPKTKFKNIELGIQGHTIAENALAVFALLSELGFEEKVLRHGLSSFKGVQRRFDFQVRREDIVVVLWTLFITGVVIIMSFANSRQETKIIGMPEIDIEIRSHAFSHKRSGKNPFD